MRHFAACADFGVLGFDEGADLAVVGELGARAQVGERTDGCPGPDDRERRVGAVDGRVLAHLAVEQRGLRSDLRAPRDRGRAGDVGAGEQHDVLGEGRADVDPGRRRILNGDARQLPAAHDHRVEASRRHGQLDAIVDTLDHPGRGRRNRRDTLPCRLQQPNRVREVLLALRVVGPDQRQLLAQRGCREDVGARVDLEDGQLVGGGVLLLGDLDECSAGVADDATVSGGVLDHRAQDGRGRGGCAMGGDESGERGGVQERDVATDHDDVALEIGGQGVDPQLDGAPGARSVVLVDNERLGHQFEDRGRHRVALVPHHRDRVGRRQLTRGRQHMPDQRNPGERMQHLRPRTLHARALPGGENDDGEAGVCHATILPLAASGAHTVDVSEPVAVLRRLRLRAFFYKRAYRARTKL